ncbi:MAG: hypothetical protein KAT43_06045 [Nanoarchaeota archaeon]|nr:hypothetical protein [Nanoarchaeota archaeon]
MKKIICLIFVLLVSLLVLTSCSQEYVSEEEVAKIEQELEQKKIVEVETLPEDLPEEEEPKTEPEPEEEPKIAAAEGALVADNPEVQEMLNAAHTTTQLKFLYRETASDLNNALVYLKDNLMHLEFTSIQVSKDDEFYTDVYLDSDSGIATAYCMNTLRCGVNYDISFDIDPADFEFDTPVDWGKRIAANAVVVSSAQLLKKDVNIIEFTITSPVKMFVYDHNKLPARVEFKDKTCTYEIYSTNIKDSDVAR